MLARAKRVPLRLEARVTGHHQDDAWFSTFTKEPQAHVSDICHLTIKANPVLLFRTLRGLSSPAPTLEYLSLSMDMDYPGRQATYAFIPDTLFNGTTPRLSCLELHKCTTSWKSPLLKGIRHLEICLSSEHLRPSLSDWLDALNEILQLTKLILHSASPIAPPFPSGVERTAILPFLTYLHISSSSAGECALALSHLILPALAQLHIEAMSVLQGGDDVLKLLPYVARHSHGLQYSQPLQNVLIHGDEKHISIIAGPDVDINWPIWVTDTTNAHLALTLTCQGWWLSDPLILKEVIAVLPLENLVKLTAQNQTPLDKGFWHYHAPRWPLLKYV